MKELRKTWLTGLMIFSLVPVLQGCDSRDVAVGLGVVGVVAGAIAIGAATDSNDNYDDYDGHHGGHHDDRDGHKNSCRGDKGKKCYTYRNHKGEKVKECKKERNNCDRNYSNVNLALANKDVTSVDWAQTFGLSFDSAEKLVAALESSRQGDIQAILDLGLSEQDIEDLAQLKMISKDGIQSLSVSLNQFPEDTQSMINSLIKTAKVDVANPEGKIWQACVEAGSWKTPQNSQCSRTFWAGCSLETGATMCVPNL